MIAAVCLVVWALIALLLAWCEGLSIYSSRTVYGLISAIRSIVRGKMGTSFAFLCWMWVGWHLFAR